MKKYFNRKLWAYIGRFSVIHLITFSLVSTIFLIFQNALPASERVALEFFEPYRHLSLIVISNQFIKSVVLALILYPFYDKIFKSDKGWLFIFTAIWGLALLGSVQPMPGSIEGLVYTKTTLAEHLVVLLAGAVQIFLFSTVIFYWERKNNKESYSISDNVNINNNFWSYMGRFILIHIITYVAVGFAFYNLQNYDGAMESMEAFKLYRDLENPIVAASVLPVQLIRGGLLSLFIYPFYSVFIKKDKGWLLLFDLVYGLTFAVLMFSDLPETIIEGFKIADILVGPLEVSVQMLVFSWLFFKWEKKRRDKSNVTKLEK